MSNDKITIEVQKDGENIPKAIFWNSDELEIKKEAKAMFLSFWDQDEQTTLSLNLWSKKFRQDEMKTFFLQTISGLCDAYLQANEEEKEVVEKIQKIIGESFRPRS